MEKKITKKVVKKSEVPYMPPLAASPEYVTREAFHAQVIDMSEAMDNRFGAINSKFEERTQYQGWMVSPVLWKRCIATLGHAVLAYVAIGVVVVAFLMLIGA